MLQMVTAQRKRCGSNVFLQFGRSIGNRLAKRNTKGVRRAQGNWSRMAACNARVHGMSVPPTKFTPSTNATSPHPRSENSQPMTKGPKGRKNLIAILLREMTKPRTVRHVSAEGILARSIGASRTNVKCLIARPAINWYETAYFWAEGGDR
jgi:hypothetical protein